MSETLATITASGPIEVCKTAVEHEACKAYAQGLAPVKSCPYPLKTAAALHWLAIYNLCMPLPRHETCHQA